MKDTLTIALAGNPNAGKTTIYNALTGARQHIGNYPGVTVEKKESMITYNNQQLKIIDLPGTYSLTAYSVEEVVARNVIINEKPDVVVDIIDSSNLERNLYLAVQLMELRIPLVFVFNMKDMAQEMGIKIDVKSLSNLFCVPIIETVGSKGDGVKTILEEAIKVAKNPEIKYPVITYDKVIEKYVNSVEELIKKYSTNIENYNTRWLAVKLLEGDKDVMQTVPSPIVAEEVKRASVEIDEMLGDSPETAIASARYGFISGACQECVTTTVEARHNMSDAIDSVLVNRVLGIPIFLGLMYLVFQLTFTLGDPFMGWIEQFFGFLGEKASVLITHDLLRSLIVDGIIGGVGGVIVFLPNIIFLFIAIAVLEASGYMARVAFIMDKVMHKIGLHGKSFIPFLIGFGCSVPAIMATRTLDNQRDRILTMLVTPFMSCGARLPIYLLIIPAFFDKNQALVLWVVYLIGIIMAIVVAKILGLTVLKGESAPFVMELPPYRIPTLKGVLMQMWERSWLYLKKAGTIILFVSIVMWALTVFPLFPAEKAAEYENKLPELEQVVETKTAELEKTGYVIMTDENMQQAEEINSKLSNEELLKAEQLMAEIDDANMQIEQINNDLAEAELENSAAGRIGKFIEPVLTPIGFDWKIGTALIGAFAAKEVFVAQMGIVYSLGEAGEDSDALREKLRENYSALTGFAIMVFALLSAPCMATFAIVKRESNSWKWPILQFFGMTAIAYIITFIIYQAGKLFM
ncbi:MAG: ferrous iron transport protein B [Mucispirillum sp.]|uniref:Ferrous iron transport protein B n=1 Tax=Candidatus Mucispirillum faecigallinarum TaxID=2838699 RepID=A0A9D2KCE2_9BACT|nr:ferrous iron transport protein B [Mucispirillum sp.]HIZ88943.1 ferrous iron transport protein B [Candidatus Mucispirillum faecigallinarum]